MIAGFSATILAAALVTVIGGSVAHATLGTNDYPSNLASAAKDSAIDPWGFYNRECVSFVAWRLNNDNGVAFTNNMNGGHWGNAYQWPGNATALGYAFNAVPAPGSVAQWAMNYDGAGSAGHVAYVDSVNLNGDGSVASIVVEEYNHDGTGHYDTRTITSGSTSWPSGFIHIKDLPGGTVQTGPDDPKGNFEAMSQVSAGVRLTGWALDPDTSNSIEVDVYEGTCCANPRGAFMANLSRPDVGSAYPGYGDNHGFDITLALPEGLTGSKTYCVYAINVGAGSVSPQLGCRTVTFNWNPIGNFENIRRVPGGVHLTGWDLDFDTTGPLETDVYEGSCCANPRGAFTANVSRPDVAAAFPGSGDTHGFEIDIGAAPTSTTTKTYCVYADNVSYGDTNPQLGCRSITISPDATGNFESIQAVPGGAEVVGWTLDQDTANSTEVDLYEGACCTNPIGAFTANVARPDVGMAWLGYGDDHGFDITLSLPPGNHTICAYGINAPGTAGNNITLGCKSVAVT